MTYGFRDSEQQIIRMSSKSVERQRLPGIIRLLWVTVCSLLIILVGYGRLFIYVPRSLRAMSPTVAGTSVLPEPLPKLVAFDLDYTLWPLWVDTHCNPPVKRRGNDLNRVYDRSGQAWRFYKDVASILLQLRHSNVEICACSRTSAPEVARQMLKELLVPASEDPVAGSSSKPIPAIELFDQMEIYPGSKLKHFRALHKRTGIAYDDMLFFDDESRNREVSSLGVSFVLTPDGVDRRIFEQGLAQWRKAKAEGEASIVTRLDRDARV